MLVELWGHEVAVAENGEQAIRLTLRQRPEIVVLDIGLPDMNGYMVAQRIRAAQKGHEPFLIAYTGWARAEDRQHAREAGFDTYMIKPGKPNELQALIAAAPKSGEPRRPTRER